MLTPSLFSDISVFIQSYTNRYIFSCVCVCLKTQIILLCSSYTDNSFTIKQYIMAI